ncbi:DUF882 domain-containing protein [Rhizobium sp. LC145]|uniref:DUF882 domain-containing protein n=1 Tax=Rhizobium sp. LC145 TaxID=1120688 RepID=UPI000629F774|nr:DUF882 domain-containing protein [Rhizobium sp. LC145]KKX29462.1 hypothetical protein YH62_17015 [Rhizobium sp. LC145]MDX3928008.1 DUF882 domain-containing protein [Shinella sp.]
MSEFFIETSTFPVSRPTASIVYRVGKWAAQSMAAALLALPAYLGSACMAAADDRSLKLFFTHTGERATITYKRDGKFDPKGLAQINRFLRDWRKNEPARMDPRLLDLVWEVYDRSGAKDYIHIVSAYRSPATNNMLRGRSRNTGVAKNSQHVLGKAMDFYIPGVKLATLRALAMQMQVGGVGYYPTSGSPFVHLDVGNVRAWPRMSRQELARIFPNGRTMHLPANGKPLPGYEQAVADYRRRVGPKSIEIASTARDNDDAAPARASLLTAMLPSRKSRAEDALELQAKPQVSGRAEERPEFVDLAALAVPVPTIRPAATVADAAVETASLGPLPSIPGNDLRAAAPLTTLRQPPGSMALLPITPTNKDAEDGADAQEAIVSWALSAPGGSNGIMAPVFVRRSLTGAATEARVATETLSKPLPLPIAEEFDRGRFWADG